MEHTKREYPEQWPVLQFVKFRDAAVITNISSNFEPEIYTQHHEQREAHDLERQPGNHNIDAGILRAHVISAGREGAACRLEDQADDVAADEGYGVCSGREAPQVRAVNDDESGEA